MVVTLDDYRRDDPDFRVRLARRHLRKAALKPGESPPTSMEQARAVKFALAVLEGKPLPGVRD